MRLIRFFVRLALSLVEKQRFIKISPNFKGNIWYFDRAQRSFLKIYSRGHADAISAYQVFSSIDYNLESMQRWHELHTLYCSAIESGVTPLIVDCGANIGCSVLYFKLLFPLAHVVAVEPSVENCVNLRKNTAHLSGVDVVEAAVGCTAGSVGFIDESADANALRTDRESISGNIPLVTMLELFREHNEKLPFIVKVDIEGFESDLFSENIQWVEKTPIIIMEPHDWMLPKSASSRNFLVAISQSHRDFLIVGENIVSYANSRSS